MIALTAVAEKRKRGGDASASPGLCGSGGKADRWKGGCGHQRASITDQQAQIEDIVKRKTEVSAENIIIRF